MSSVTCDNFWELFYGTSLLQCKSPDCTDLRCRFVRNFCVAFSWVLQDERNERSILPLRHGWMVCLAEIERCSVLGFKTTPYPRAGCVWLTYFVARSTFRNEPLTRNMTAPYVPSYLQNMPLGSEFHSTGIWVPQIDSPYHTFHQESL